MAEEPRGHHAMFGDGLFALFKRIDYKPEEDCYEVLMKTTLAIREKFKLPSNAIYVTEKYPRKYCKPINLSPGTEAWFLLCDFAKEPSNLFEDMDKELMINYENTKKECAILRAKNAKLLYLLDEAVRNPMGFRNMIYKDMEKVKKLVSAEVVAAQGAFPPPMPGDEE